MTLATTKGIVDVLGIQDAGTLALFELRRLSSRKTAELCGMGRVEFLLALPRVGIPLSNLGLEDADDEAAFANRT